LDFIAHGTYVAFTVVGSDRAAASADIESNLMLAQSIPIPSVKQMIFTEYYNIFVYDIKEIISHNTDKFLK
jgi:predicted amino acid-binding ACT domain protein